MAETRNIYYDSCLELETYQLSGIVQKFPNHFHSFYVIGFIEGGGRHLWCKGQEYDLNAGDMILFNPEDSHCCAPVGDAPLDYRAVNISKERMEQLWKEITGRPGSPRFSNNVLKNCPLTEGVSALYRCVVERAPELEREEACYWLMEQLFLDYTVPSSDTPEKGGSPEIQALCRLIETRYHTNITLDEMAQAAHISKTGVLRLFTKEKGVTPYRYLQSVRIQHAKELLERQIPLHEAAYASGFSDQSHFTNYFKEFTGVTPGQYQRIFQNLGEEETR